jgi:hypothetical protein
MVEMVARYEIRKLEHPRSRTSLKSSYLSVDRPRIGTGTGSCVVSLCRAARAEAAGRAVVVRSKVGYPAAGRTTVVDELGMFLDGHDACDCRDSIRIRSVFC